MRKTLFKVAFGAALCGITFTSCNKKEEAQPEETAVQDNNSGFNESEELIAISDEVLVTNGSGGLRVSAETPTYYGATVTITPKGKNPTGKVEIDFGTAGIKGKYGRTHKGKIIITYTNVMPVDGAQRIIDLENYSVDDTKIEGTKTITFTNESLQVFTADIISALKITTKDGKVALWNTNRSRTYDTKGTLANLSDDEVSLSGTATGTTRNGIAYTATITTPLVIKASCLSSSGWLPSSGVLEVTPAGSAKRTVSYGSGTCDRVVTVSVNNQSFDVIIK